MVNKLDDVTKIAALAARERELPAGWTKSRGRGTGVNRMELVSQVKGGLLGIGQPGEEGPCLYLTHRYLFREGDGEIDQQFSSEVL